MHKVSIVEHKNVSAKLLAQIIDIKAISWPYSYENQMNWMSNNLAEDDLHVLLFKDNSLLAYMNLVNVTLLFDNQKYNVWGIGNVCAKERGKGFGKLLMSEVNSLLKVRNQIGILLCKEALIKYYLNCNWIVYEGDVFVRGRKMEHILMYYNASVTTDVLHLSKYF